MNLSELVRWQANGYERFHATRVNLAVHLALVPVFQLGNLTLFVALSQGSLGVAVASATAMAISMAFQGKGHAMETIPTVPFSSWKNALTRVFLEQWLTFPRFVISGHFLRAWRAAAR